jgi:hypothetical protein
MFDALFVNDWAPVLMFDSISVNTMSIFLFQLRAVEDLDVPRCVAELYLIGSGVSVILDAAKVGVEDHGSSVKYGERLLTFRQY